MTGGMCTVCGAQLDLPSVCPRSPALPDAPDPRMAPIGWQMRFAEAHLRQIEGTLHILARVRRLLEPRGTRRAQPAKRRSPHATT